MAIPENTGVQRSATHRARAQRGLVARPMMCI
ncbi:hypothetical protein SNOG_02216 [Parastagonospora nodorum SN15]|uniref:Uncharacterized protein n=1 Tax=Phaeosphaeria nodorum (strain SN15 / ATCC MYA-4574 / FGSC 10173) TaxID=321614 RepID=Q0V198_PHANO|nr:hypothetical protein SNOG_02216 [Parastagonospora nodorum SN15]EAT90428.1 hypothetical protein SNOG_02216 [Parastagonospora nodorum SN15]